MSHDASCKLEQGSRTKISVDMRAPLFQHFLARMTLVSILLFDGFLTSFIKELQ